jgi:hypothetical protein
VGDISEEPTLRPEALRPVRSALPLLLALSTALLAGALGGFVLHGALPGEDPPPIASPVPEARRVIVPPCGTGQTYGGGKKLFHYIAPESGAAPEKAKAPAPKAPAPASPTE